MNDEDKKILEEQKNPETHDIKISDLLRVCKNFIKNPGDMVIADEYSKMLESLKIRSYLPMQEKVIALVRMVIDSDKSVDIEPSFFTAGLELACCFDGLLAYVNVLPEIDLSVKSYENYDLIYQSGVADYILQYCQKDYERLVRMLERTLSFENLQELVDSISKMDVGSLRDLTDTIKEVEKNIDPEVIENLANIAIFNDPNLYNLKTSLEEEALENANKN